MIVSATHLQIQITLLMNRFIASDERVLCLGRALLTLEENLFSAGDKYFSAGDERTENAHLSFSQTHTASLVYARLQLATSDFQAEFMSR